MVEKLPDDEEPTKIRRAKRYDFTQWRPQDANDPITFFDGPDVDLGELSEYRYGPLSIASAFAEQALCESDD